MCCCRRKCETRGSFEIARSHTEHRRSQGQRWLVAEQCVGKGRQQTRRKPKNRNNPEQDSQNSRGEGLLSVGSQVHVAVDEHMSNWTDFFCNPCKASKRASAFRWETRSGSCLIEFRIHGIVLLQLYFWAAVCGWVPHRPWLCCFGGEGVNTAVNRHYSQCSFSFIAATVVAKAACGA